MRKKPLSQLALGAFAILWVGCGRVGLMAGADGGGADILATGGTNEGGAGGHGGATGASGSGSGTAIAPVLGGAPGSGGIAGSGGRGGGGGIIIRLPDGGLPPLPDGGLATLLGDSGILNGILDAPRDSLIGQLVCGPEAKSGAACGTGSQGCVLPSLGGACLCLAGTYLCPANTAAGPETCPAHAASGTTCSAPLTTCVGGGAVACICGLGTYVCF